MNNTPKAAPQSGRLLTKEQAAARLAISISTFDRFRARHSIRPIGGARNRPARFVEMEIMDALVTETNRAAGKLDAGRILTLKEIRQRAGKRGGK